MLLLLLACGTDTTVGKSGEPVVEILSPEDGTRFVPATVLSLCATVSDDGPFDDLDMHVQSSLDGEVATAEEGDCDGGNVTASFQLGEGTHDLQLIVYDVDGNSGIDHVEVQGEADEAPFCSIDSPRDGGVVDRATTFTLLSTVSDAETAVEDLLVTIESTVAGDLWAGNPNLDGTVSVELLLETAGADTLIVGVTDDREQRSTCTAAITVDDCVDLDGDGVENCDGDCDDADPTVFPGATELENGVDEDCNGLVDDTTRLYDDDGDGYAEIDGDCDDADASAYPGAPDLWYDGKDANCDGTDDDQDHDGYPVADDCADLDASINPGASDRWYDGVDSNCDGVDDFDQDGDGYSSDAYGGDDCDDTEATVFPGAPETYYDGVDQDCSGDADSDQDGDGYSRMDLGGSDCDDTDASVHPDASEIWYDDIDQDCDGNDDDQDGDGWDLGPDCDDTDPLINPDATEIWYDGVDTDCDGWDDNDQDFDGFATDVDCDDTVGSVYPGATETRDGYDNDCDDACDEGLILSGDLIITELLKDPDVVGDSDGEYFEVYNPTAVDIRMCGWTVNDLGTDSFTMTAGEAVLVEAGGFAVFGRNASKTANGGVDVAYEFGSDLTLGNGGDEVVLSIDGVEIDRVDYTDGGVWPDPTGLAFGLDPSVLLGPVDATSNDDGADWCSQSSFIGGVTTADKGTPGAGNDPC